MYFTDYPVALLGLWTINIFGSMLAGFLLLFRSKWAPIAALASAISMLILNLFTFALRDRLDVLGVWVSLFDLLLMVLTFAFYWYCRQAALKGVLR